ncbi:HNH endonuclease family protein [Brachybacterium sp. DNPG3]
MFGDAAQLEAYLDEILGGSGTTSTSDYVPAADGATALDELESLEVEGFATKAGYDRDSFGWRDDVDGNGCDTRNDVLRRDLTDIVLEDGTKDCVVETGVLSPSAYTGEIVEFDRHEDNNLDIDHVVALSNAWQTGAYAWDDDVRRELANDPLNLVAAEDSLNSSKGDKDASAWLPPLESYHCEYVARQIAVKAKYELWVTPDEKAAMQDVLATCEDYPAFTEPTATPAAGEFGLAA